MLLAARLRVKVGPKGQVVIPKMFREAYCIKENSYAVIEPTYKGLLIRSVCRTARLGDLVDMDLEEEFEG